MPYPNIHEVPDPFVSHDLSRLSDLWERYPRYRDMKPAYTLDQLLEMHESCGEDFDQQLRGEYEEYDLQQFLVPLSWSDLSYRKATAELIKNPGHMPENEYVRNFMDQFSGWDTDRKAYFLFPESCMSQFFVIMDVCRRAEELCPVRNLFPDEERVHFLAVFDKGNMEDVLLMYHLVYGGSSQEMPGSYSLYDYSLPWYQTHLMQDGIVLRSPFLPDRLAKYQGGLLSHLNPAKTVYVRRNVKHILDAGYFRSELEFFRSLTEVIMPLFQWWYLDLSLYEEKDGLRTDWRLERTRIRTRLTSEGFIRPKWKHELSLFQAIREKYPDTLYQYHPDWVGNQSFDIYIPCLDTAVEYLGIQHYTPVGFFGGEEALAHRRELDRKKAALCKENGVRLIEWPYRLEPTDENIRRMLSL